MVSRSQAQKKAPQQSTSASVQNQLRSRPFAPPVQAEATPQAEAPDLQTQLENATRLGHSFAKLSTPSIAKLPLPPTVQRHQEEDELQRQPDVSTLQRHEEHNEDNIIHRQADNSGSFEASNTLESQIKGNQSSGQPLDAEVRSFMEPRFQHSFANVRVHTNRQAVQMNQELHAQAFTNGNHIYFNSGKYTPSSNSGKELLAHELTHTIQQTGGNELQRQENTSACSAGCACASCVPVIQRKPDGAHGATCPCSNCAGGTKLIQAKLTVGAPGDSYEQEADLIAAQVMRMPEPSQTDSVQRHEDEDEMAQMQPLGQSMSAILQRRENKDQLSQPQPVTVHASLAPPLTAPGLIQRHSSWEHQLLGDAQPNELAQIGTWQELIEQTKLEVKEKRAFYQKDVMGPKQDEAVVNIPKVGPIKKGNVMHVLAQELGRLDQWQKNPPTKGSSGDIDPTYQTVLVSIPGGGKEGEPLVITYGEMNTLADYYGNLEAMKTADPKVRWTLIQSVRQETFFRLKDIYTQLKDSLTDTEKTDQNVQDSEQMMQGNTLVNQKLGYKFKDAILQDYISGVPGQINLLAVTGSGAKESSDEYGATLARNACHFAPESWHAWAGYHDAGRKAAQQSWTLNQQAKAAAKEASDLQDASVLMAELPFGDLEGQDDLETRNAQIALKEQESVTLADKASEAANEALLNNGFGDHYLQDSYAAGHMINKTQIMQWFVQWLDTQKWTMDFASAETWRKIQQVAYNQPGIASAMQYDKTQVQGYDATQTTNRAKNPQAVEDSGNDWKDRFDAAGLQVPASLQNPASDERALMEWWQTQTIPSADALEQTHANLLAQSPLRNADTLNAALSNLTQDRIVRLEKNTFSPDKYILRGEYRPKDQVKFETALTKSKGDDNTRGDDTSYQRMAAAVTYEDYLAFLNNAYVQKSTNALHNVFCEKGMEVSDGQNSPLFKVYGDDAMFNKDSAVGVKHSGKTANMSRDAIRNTIQTGTDGGITAQKILNRLPKFVKPEGANARVDIEAWHDPNSADQLKNFCNTKVFPSMGIADKFVALKGSATSGMSSFISKDKAANVHGSEAF